VVLEKESRIKSSQRFGSLVKIYKEMKYLKKYNEQIDNLPNIENEKQFLQDLRNNLLNWAVKHTLNDDIFRLTIIPKNVKSLAQINKDYDTISKIFEKYGFSTSLKRNEHNVKTNRTVGLICEFILRHKFYMTR
jgi:pyruvate carboxylase